MTDFFETPKAAVKLSAKECAALFAKADAAGKAAAVASVPVPMLVSERTNPLNDSSPVKNAWLVSEGACGFAWVTVRPGNCSFANWLKKNAKARPAYYGGTEYWISDYGQSIERKEAYASAFAKVVSDAGIKAYSGSRLD